MALDTRIASRYAKSILDLAIERNSLDSVYSDMLSINKAFSNRDFILFVRSPIIKADKKQTVFAEVFGDSIGELVKTFFIILSRKGRESFLPEIVESFLHQYKKYNKITEVKLTTAQALGESSLNDIKKALLRSSVTDENIEIETKVNPNLIGGFVIEMDHKLYDASVAHKLEQIKKNFQDK